MKQKLKLKFPNLLLLFILISAPNLYAQNNNKSPNNLIGVLIESNPSGAIVQITGQYKFIGRTPFIIPYKIYGKYKIKASKEGYEGVSTNIDLLKKGQSTLTIRLSKKTRFKAAYRSLFFPGWGQIYGDNKLRGVFISTIQAGFGIRALIAINDYNKAQDNLQRALDVFERNKDENAFKAVQDKFNKAENAHSFRNTMLFITAGFWVYNILDSIFFFSSKSTHIEINTNRFSQNLNDKKVMLTMKIGL